MIFAKPSNISQNQLNSLKIDNWLLLLMLLFAATNVSAQNPFVQHFTTFEGLPSNRVYKIFQDNKKFIWFATDAGVSRYDGSKFIHYRKQDGLSSNEILSIKEDSFGRIWFFNKNSSLNFFQNNTIYNEKSTPFLDSLKSQNSFRRFYEDDNHNIYFYFHPDLLIYSLDKQNQVTKYKLPSILVKNNLRPRIVQGMSIRYMKKDVNGEFIFWTPGGCYKTKKLSQRPILINDTLKFRDIITSSTRNKYAIVHERDSGTFEIKRFNEEIVYGKMESVASLVSDNISSIIEDHNGFLWLSTSDKGVFCFNGSKIIYHFDIRDATSIIQDHEENIWISSLKEGVYKISPFFHLHQHFGIEAFQNSGILALSQTDSLGIWCTNGKLVYFLKDNELYESENFQLTDQGFNQLIQVSQRTLLIGEIGKLPYALEGLRINHSQKKISIDKVSRSPLVLNKIIYNEQKNEISSFKTNSIVSIPQDQLFKKLTIKGLTKQVFNTYYNTKNELIINSTKNYIYQLNAPFFKECKELSDFNNQMVSDHLNLDENTELFNLEGDSLFILYNKRLYNLTAAFDQPINLQIKHLAYQDSTLYIATSRNIYVCKNPLNSLKRKPVDLNLININFKSIHSILFRDEKLYVASDEGLDVIPYKYLRETNSTPPIPYFQSIQVNELENLVKSDKISMISGNRINITFSSINYSIFPAIYSYKLEGSDTDWITVKGNDVVFQNLSKGQYTFKLRSGKSSSEWSQPIDFGITVNATFWQHPLFYFFILLCVSGFAFLIVLRRKNIELDRRQMEHQIILLEQKSLQAMMNPHFIFNSIGSIQNYLLHNKPDEAGIYLSQFARLIRQNLNAIDTSMVNLEEEVDRLRNYMDLEKLRMENKFDYIIEIDEEVESENILIPSMIIQPFVENSIWHGISYLEEHGSISLSFLLHNEKSLQIIVEDNGIGLKKAEKYRTGGNQHLKLGMNITKKRLELLSRKYNIEAGYTYSEKFPGAHDPGTKVVIIVPLLFGKSDLN